MALKRNIGTNDVEVGKLFRNIGTNDVQIGKMHRNNGTTDNLIYTAAEPVIAIPNASAYPASAWQINRTDNTNTPNATGHAIANTSITVNASSVTFSVAAREGGHWTCYYIPVVVDGLKTLTIKGTIYGDNAQACIGLFDSAAHPSYNTMIAGYTNYENENERHTLNHTYTFEEMTGTKYLVVGNWCTASGDRGWLYPTLTEFSLTE